MACRRFALIVNPHSGIKQTPRILSRIQPILSDQGATVDVFLTEYRGHGSVLARTLELERYERLGIVGGDGTIHDVINGLLQRSIPVTIPVAVIPAGSGNSVSRHLGIVDVDDAARRMATGHPEPIDVIRVSLPDEQRYCLNIVGWGMAVDINRVAERLRWLGPVRYALAALWGILRPHLRPARIELDGLQTEGDFLLAMGCNTRFTGRGMQLAPLAELNDGKMDVVLVHRISRRRMLQLFRTVFAGRHLDIPGVEYHQVATFSLASSVRSVLNLDGELLGTSAFTAEIIPAALRVARP